MKERPMLFNGPMVRAILNGTKTQTRRVVKPQNYIYESGPGSCEPGRLMSAHNPYGPVYAEMGCPYGWIGDRLWVRETWSKDAVSIYPCPSFWYRADFLKYDDPAMDVIGCSHSSGQGDCFPCWEKSNGKFRWRPSIHMPRKASRIQLEITDVRVERVTGISDDDCYAEGTLSYAETYADSHDGFKFNSIKYAFLNLWNSVADEKTNWAANPWVWVVEFKRVGL